MRNLCKMALVVICCFSAILMTGRQVSSTTPAIIQPADHKVKQQTMTNERPIIGVLTEVLRDYKKFVDKPHLCLVSSYVKWIESAGGRVIPILLNQNQSYYEHIFTVTNGLLLPGGDNLLDPKKRTPMLEAAQILYKMAVDANDRGDFYPIWGTCLGLEALTVLTSGVNKLASCSALDVVLSSDVVARGKLFAPSSYLHLTDLGNDYSEIVRNHLTKDKLVYHFHRKCITDDTLKQANLNSFYKPLAYSKDINNVTFVSMLEANKYPFFGVQFHPEKPPAEFVVKSYQKNIPHGSQSIAVSRYFADFFINQAKFSQHRATNESELTCEFIYAYTPTYTKLKHDIYEQRYLFPFVHKDGVSEEEFVHGDFDEEDIFPPEDITKRLR